MTFTVSLILLLTLFTVPAFASGDTLATEEVTEAEVIIDQTEASIFDDIYDAVLTNADKILSALAFCGTVIVGFAYKKGLLPSW